MQITTYPKYFGNKYGGGIYAIIHREGSKYFVEFKNGKTKVIRRAWGNTIYGDACLHFKFNNDIYSETL